MGAVAPRLTILSQHGTLFKIQDYRCLKSSVRKVRKQKEYDAIYKTQS